jgi:hypothetical protein
VPHVRQQVQPNPRREDEQMHCDKRQTSNEPRDPVAYPLRRRTPIEKLLLMLRDKFDLFLYVIL